MEPISRDDLLGGPLGGRERGDVEVQHAPTLVGEDQEDEEDLVAHGRHDERVGRDDIPDVVLEERSPGSRGRPTAADRVANFSRDRRPPRLPRATQPSPVFAEPPPFPRDHGLGLHENQGALPIGPDSREPSPEQPVSGLQARSGISPLIDRELVPEGEDLDLQGEPGTEQGMDEGEDGA